MPEVLFDTPALYGDHHVSEARRILLELPGIQHVYASSCFHVVQVTYDAGQIAPEAIAACLSSAGYLDPLPVQAESGVAGESASPLRHSTAAVGPARSLAFTQPTFPSTRHAWPCPGMGLLKPQS